MNDTAHYYYSGNRGCNYPSCFSSSIDRYPNHIPKPKSDNADIIKSDSFFEKTYDPYTGAWVRESHMAAQFDAQNNLTISEKVDNSASFSSKYKYTAVYAAGRLSEINFYDGGVLYWSAYKYYDGGGNNIKDSIYGWMSSTAMLEFKVFDGSNRIVLDSTFSLAYAHPMNRRRYYYSTNLDSVVLYENSRAGLVFSSRETYAYNTYNNRTVVRSQSSMGRTVDSFAYAGSNPNWIFRQRWNIDTSSAYVGQFSKTCHLNNDGNWDTIYTNYWNRTTLAFEPTLKRALNYNSHCNVDTGYYWLYDTGSRSYPDATLSKETFYYGYFEDGITDQKTSGVELTVYPNPARETLNIDWPKAQSNKLVTAVLTNLLGQQVHTQTGYWQGAKNELQIGAVTPGLYLLTITDETGGVIGRERITKQ